MITIKLQDDGPEDAIYKGFSLYEDCVSSNVYCVEGSDEIIAKRYFNTESSTVDIRVLTNFLIGGDTAFVEFLCPSITNISCGYDEDGAITSDELVTVLPDNPHTSSPNEYQDKWYKFVTPANGYPTNNGYGPEISIEFYDDKRYGIGDPDDPPHDGFIALYHINPWTNQFELVDYRYGRIDNWFSMSVELGAGVTYYIRVASTSPSPNQEFELSCFSKL